MEKALYSCPAAGGGDRNKCGQIKVKDVTPAFSAVTPISEEVTPKVSELCIIGVLLHVGAKYALLKNRQLVCCGLITK